MTRSSVRAAYKALTEIFYKEGLAVAKERALTFVLADILNVRLTAEQLDAKVMAAVKEENEKAHEQIRDICTVDADEKESDAKTELVNALLTSDSSNKTTLNKKSFKQLATDYLRYYYGVDSLDKLPKDLVTKESYLKAVDEQVRRKPQRSSLHSRRQGYNYPQVQESGYRL